MAPRKRSSKDESQKEAIPSSIRVLPLSEEQLKDIEQQPRAYLLTKEELRQKLNLPHVRLIEEMVRKRKLPVVKLGYRTQRFDWNKVQVALERLTVREVGA